MKLSINGFEQEKLVEYGLDANDVIIIQHIMLCCNSNMQKFLSDENDVYVWLTEEKINEDLPLLKLGKRGMYERLSNLLKKELIKKEVKCDKGYKTKKTFYCITKKTSNMYYKSENKKESLTMSNVSNECQGKSKILDIRDKSIDIDIDNNKKENINTSINIKEKEAKIIFGEYKRVKLTQTQYDKLVEDFGKNKIDIQIRLVDEYVESNNNKNKYSNYNLVIRKSIKDNWFNNKNSNNPYKPRTQTADEDMNGAF